MTAAIPLSEIKTGPKTGPQADAIAALAFTASLGSNDDWAEIADALAGLDGNEAATVVARRARDLANQITPSTYLEVAARMSSLTIGDITGRRQDRTAAEARHVAAWLLRERTTLSYPQIGAILGRDHTTVHSSVERVRAEIGTDTPLARLARYAEMELRG